MSWCCLTSGDERFAIKIEGYGRNDVAHEALSKLRGASDFYAPHHHFSFEQSFRTQSRGIPSRGLTPNPEPLTLSHFSHDKFPLNIYTKEKRKGEHYGSCSFLWTARHR